MKTAVIEINPDWKAALKAGAKGISQAAKSGRVQHSRSATPAPNYCFLKSAPSAGACWKP